MPIIFKIIFVISALISGLAILLDNKKIISIKKEGYKITLYFVFIIALLLACVSLFGKPILKKINAYQAGVLMESEEQCKADNAPYWCNL